MTNMRKQFKRGDKIRIIQDFIDSRLGESGQEGIFQDYTMPPDVERGYPYIVNTAQSTGLLVHDIELADFVLPEKWCIRQNSAQEVCNWFNQEYDISSCLKGSFLYLVYKGKYCSSPYSDGIPEGYTEITLEQFQKYVLKKDNMEKILKGYRLVKKEYAEAALKIEGNRRIGTGIKHSQILLAEHTESVDTLRKAGVLDLWFEPVYEEEYKVGDVVVVLSTETYNYGSSSGETRPIVNNIYTIQEIIGDNVKLSVVGRGYIFIGISEIRKATQEEIEAFVKVEIAGFTAKKTSYGVKFGCQEFTLADIKSYKKLISPEVDGSIVVRGQTITFEILDKLDKMF